MSTPKIAGVKCTQNSFLDVAMPDAYKSVIIIIKKGVTAELVDTLEKTISGHPVSEEYIQKIVSQVVHNSNNQTLDFSRVGTPGDMIRKSLAYQKINPYVIYSL